MPHETTVLNCDKCGEMLITATNERVEFGEKGDGDIVIRRGTDALSVECPNCGRENIITILSPLYQRLRGMG